MGRTWIFNTFVLFPCTGFASWTWGCFVMTFGRLTGSFTQRARVLVLPRRIFFFLASKLLARIRPETEAERGFVVFFFSLWRVKTATAVMRRQRATSTQPCNRWSLRTCSLYLFLFVIPHACIFINAYIYMYIYIYVRLLVSLLACYREPVPARRSVRPANRDRGRVI